MSFKDNNQNIAFTLPDAALKAAGAAFTGQPWVGKRGAYPQSPEVIAAAMAMREAAEAAALKANTGEEKLEAAKKSVIEKIKAAIANTTDSDAIKELEELIGKVESANSFSSLGNVMATVNAAMASNNSKTESRDEKIGRLWGEIKALDKEIQDSLYPKMTEEEKKKDEEFRRKLAGAKTEEERAAIYKEYNAFRMGVAERVEKDPTTTPAEKEELEDTKEKLRKLNDKVEAREEELKLKSFESIKNSEQTPTLPTKTVASFSGFDMEETTPAGLAEKAKSAVSPALASNFSGFDSVETPAAQNTLNVKAKEAPTRQA
jgi:hypothetical protein